MTTYTPQQAADRAGLGRTTIVRALQDGSLHGIRDNRQRWKIDDHDLSSWLSRREPTDNDGRSPDTVQMDTSGIDEIRQEIGRLQGELAARDATIEGLTVRLDETRTDRDRWHQAASRTWIDRLFGR